MLAFIQQSIMGNIACASSSASEPQQSMPSEPGSPGVEALMGFGDLSALQLHRSASEEAGKPAPSHSDEGSKGLGLTHLFRTASEEAAIEAQPKQPSKFAAFFGKKQKKDKKAQQQQEAKKSKPAAVVVAPVFVDDRPRFGLAPLTKLGGWVSQQNKLVAMPLPGLIVHLGVLAGVKSVRVEEAEKAAKDAAAKLKSLQQKEDELAAGPVVVAAPAPVVSASAVPAAAPAAPVAIDNSAFVLSASAPAAPALDGSASFAAKDFGAGVVVAAAPSAWSSGGGDEYDEDGNYIGQAYSGKTWAKGTGYGYEGASGRWDVSAYLETLAVNQQKVQFVLRKISDRFEAREQEARDIEELAGSALLPCLEAYLRNDSMNEILEQHTALYQDIFSLLAHMLAMDAPNISPLVALLAPKVAPLLRKIARSAAAVEAMDDKAPAATVAASSASSSSSSSSSSKAVVAPTTPTSYVIELSAILDAAIAQQATAAAAAASVAAVTDVAVVAAASSSSSSAPAVAKSPDELAAEYVAVLGSYKFGEVEAFSGYHKYQKANGSSASSAPISRAFTRRLAVEFADLAESLPTHVDSSVWMRVHETQMAYSQIMISGPDGTPYENGLFLFDCYFPPTYPAGPPQVNLCTTGKGSTRFNPNLYHCGKVCLSILGTWAGGAGEGWSAKSSTMLQVAVSIQSLVMVPEPYFNEPSYESTMHTAEGQRQSKAYSRPLLSATLRWAMLDQMRNPPAGFEDVVSAHFALKKDAIKAQMARWAKEDPSGINDAFIKEISDEMDKQKMPVAKQAE